MRLITTIILMMLFGACSNNSNIKDEDQKASPSPNPTKEILVQLKDNLTAHGGINQWNKFGTLTFQNRGVRHTLNLRNRNEVFTNDSTYTVGYNGGDVWVMPDSASYPRAKFYRNLYFYFFALPFVAADPGVNHEFIGQKEFDGVLYDLVKLSYESNVGDSPDDQYILYINAETKQLKMINYSVTYFNKDNSEKYSALVYTDWQNVNGLLVPTGFDGYVWENDSLGKKRYEATFENVKFHESIPSDDLFNAPQGAFVYP